MATACCCHCLTFEMVNIWTEKKKKTFLGHTRLLKAPGHSSSQDGSNSQVDQGTHSVTPFHSPFLDQWRGQGASAYPCQSAGRMVRESSFGCRQSLYLNSTAAGADLQEKRRSASPDKRPDSTRATGWTLTPRRPFMSWDHYRWRLPVFHGGSHILAGSGRKHHHPKPASSWSGKLLLT